MILITDLEEMIDRSEGALTLKELTSEFVILDSVIGPIKFKLFDE